MPQLSSFEWDPSLREGSSRSGQESSVEGQPLGEQSDSHGAPKDLVIDTEPTKFAILGLTTGFDIPIVNLSANKSAQTSSNNGPQRVSSSLGAGVSCNVSLHQTSEDIEGLPSGMNVALKKYREIPGDRASSKRLHKLLWQELKVFCHPYLRLHENVCKLHFIGWDETSLIPALGLEFAIYGTLDDCLQDLRSYHSELTKSHLSLDVALGLEAIHASGLVHGDIKPSNIIVQEHSSRPFIAKVTDFNGVSPAETYGKEYTFGTPEWLSPEVRLQCKGIDWQLADVYSFAMVTTTLWSTFGFIPLGGSFIDPLLEYTFTEEGKRMCIDCMKFEKEPGPESLVTMAISTTQAERMSEYEHFKVMSVIITGLCQRPTERLTMREMLVNSFQTFCAEVNRPLPESDRSLGIISPTEYYSYDGCEHLLVFSSAFSRASSRFQGMFFQGLLEYEKSIRNHDPTFSMLSIQEVEEGFKGDEIDLLEAFNRHDTFCESEYSGNHKIDHFAIVAAELGLSYLAGQGTPVDEKLGIEWLSKAAMAGNVTIASVFGPYEQSTSMMALGNNALPRRSWGVYATMVSGFQPSISCLEKLDPALHGLAVGAYRRKTFGPPILLAEQEQPSSTTVGSKAGPAPEMIEDVASLLCTWAGAGTLDAVKYLLETRNLGAHINTRSMAEFPIFRATLANQFEIAEYLLDMGADVSMISSKGWSLAHCLSFMDDQHAAELAPLYVSGGASLSLEALDEPRSIIGDLDRGYGEPLLWAAIKRKRRLFSVLLQCHIRTGCSLSRSRYGVIVSMLADSHETSLLEMTLKNMSDLSRMEGTMDDAEDVGEFYLELVSGLLTCALDAYAQKILRRRYVHMGNFRNAKMETLSLLLRSGADPTRPGGVQTDEKEQKTQKDALTVAVYTNDCDALRLFIEHLQSRDMEVEPLLRDLGRFEGYTALHQSIYKSSREVFMFVIERFPSLLHIPGKYQDMPLHAAATQQWTGYVQELLRRGASPHDWSTDRFTPFTMALTRSPSLETARVLAESCNDMCRILGPDEVSGFTAFGKLLDGLLKFRMSFGLERLRFLVENFGRPSIFACESLKLTVFRTVLVEKTCPTDIARLQYEKLVLKLLLETFPDDINFIDFTGRSPLHYAVSHGKMSAVKTLLEHGADIQLQMGQKDVDHIRKYWSGLSPGWITGFVGYTPLALAVMYQRNGPEESVLQGGRREVEQWERNMKEIIHLLLRSGAETGGPCTESWILTKQAAGELLPLRIGWVRNGGRTEHEDRTGQWPQRLPRDHQVDDSMVEMVGENGLNEMWSRAKLLGLQILAGEMKSGYRTGNLWTQPPAAPEIMVEELRAVHAILKKDMELKLSSVNS